MMEEAIVFTPYRLGATGRGEESAILTLTNVLGTDLIFKVETNVHPVLASVQPAFGTLAKGETAEVRIIRKIAEGTRDDWMKVRLAYSPVSGQMPRDVAGAWDLIPEDRVIEKAISCTRQGQQPGDYCLDDPEANQGMVPKGRMACMLPYSPRELGGGAPQIVYPGPDQIPTENYCDSSAFRDYCDRKAADFCGNPCGVQPGGNNFLTKGRPCSQNDTNFLLVCVCVLLGFVVGNLLLEIV